MTMPRSYAYKLNWLQSKI